jgi:hypothetical protein
MRFLASRRGNPGMSSTRANRCSFDSKNRKTKCNRKVPCSACHLYSTEAQCIMQAALVKAKGAIPFSKRGSRKDSMQQYYITSSMMQLKPYYDALPSLSDCSDACDCFFDERVSVTFALSILTLFSPSHYHSSRINLHSSTLIG